MTINAESSMLRHELTAFYCGGMNLYYLNISYDIINTRFVGLRRVRTLYELWLNSLSRVWNGKGGETSTPLEAVTHFESIKVKARH
jgi:hypothetical protein